MRSVLVACLTLLALAGCEKSTETSITRINANGVDTLYSKRTVVDGVARFECIASRSGQCHYLVLAAGCSADTACASPPLRQFAVAVGKTEKIRGLPEGFGQCVSDVHKEQCHRD